MIRKSIPNRSKMNSWVRNKAAYKRHEYLRDNVVWKYQKCESCMQRSLFSCVACGFVGVVIGRLNNYQRYLVTSLKIYSHNSKSLT